MSQELGKHMLVCCCWNRGALLRLRFGNMKDFVGWAGGLALIQGLIAREAGSKLQLWDRERNLVTCSREDRSSKQTQAKGCWANHSATLSALNPPHTHTSAPLAADEMRDLLPPDWTAEEAWTYRTGMKRVRFTSEPEAVPRSSRFRIQGSGSSPRYLEGFFFFSFFENKAGFVLFYCSHLSF